MPGGRRDRRNAGEPDGELARRGFSLAEIKQIWGGNFLQSSANFCLNNKQPLTLILSRKGAEKSTTMKKTRKLFLEIDLVAYKKGLSQQ